MAQPNRSESGSGSGSHHNAGSSSTPRYGPVYDSTPRYLPPASYQFVLIDGGSATSGTGHMSHYQPSSSSRGCVTNTDHYCIIVCTTWACGHEISKSKRHRSCWKCLNLDVGLCQPEPVEIDKTSECAECRERREGERRRRDQARAEARERERQRDRVRERSPRRASPSRRRRSV